MYPRIIPIKNSYIKNKWSDLLMDVFISEPDHAMGKVLKYQKPNPVGEDMYLLPDGTVVRDEDKIISAQRIFKHNWYRPGGKGAKLALAKYASCTDQSS